MKDFEEMRSKPMRAIGETGFPDILSGVQLAQFGTKSARGTPCQSSQTG
jgi:hypothetical protein